MGYPACLYKPVSYPNRTSNHHPDTESKLKNLPEIA
jgi:hypothetical protein